MRYNTVNNDAPQQRFFFLLDFHRPCDILQSHCLCDDEEKAVMTFCLVAIVFLCLIAFFHPKDETYDP